MVEPYPVLYLKERTNVEKSGSRTIGRQLADTTNDRMQTDKVLVHDEIVVVNRNYGIGAIFVSQQHPDIAPLDGIETQMRPELGEAIQILLLSRYIQIGTRIILRNRLAEFGSSRRALAVADNDKIHILVAVVAGIFCVLAKVVQEC